jgi:hypothetical protein
MTIPQNSDPDAAQQRVASCGVFLNFVPLGTELFNIPSPLHPNNKLLGISEEGIK